MSFGKPSSTFSVFKPTPPDRGAFPLDHDGECKNFMSTYLQCLKTNANESTPCRELSQAYLQCRMNHGLMDRDDFSNLGFRKPPISSSASATQDSANDDRDKNGK